MKKRVSGNLWANLSKPFFAIAPMANVTDSVFRKLFAKYGKPDVMWTEFVSADGLNSVGQKKLLVDLKYSEKERPIVAQLFTGHPDEMKKAATLVARLGFDGLDINMGCPDRAVQKQGGGAALIKNPKIALNVLEAARAGTSIPVSIDSDRFQFHRLKVD
jgi:tRNA-dihydrouridine synthase